MQRLPPPPAALGPFGRVVATLVAVVLGLGMFMFSLVLFVGVLIVGLAFGGYLWWKTRAFRALLREQRAQAGRDRGPPAAAGTSTVIEGEYVEIDAADREPPPRP